MAAPNEQQNVDPGWMEGVPAPAPVTPEPEPAPDPSENIDPRWMEGVPGTTPETKSVYDGRDDGGGDTGDGGESDEARSQQELREAEAKAEPKIPGYAIPTTEQLKEMAKDVDVINIGEGEFESFEMYGIPKGATIKERDAQGNPTVYELDNREYFAPGSTPFEFGWRTYEEYKDSTNQGFHRFGPHPGSDIPPGSIVILSESGRPLYRTTAEELKRIRDDGGSVATQRADAGVWQYRIALPSARGERLITLDAWNRMQEDPRFSLESATRGWESAKKTAGISQYFKDDEGAIFALDKAVGDGVPYTRLAPLGITVGQYNESQRYNWAMKKLQPYQTAQGLTVQSLANYYDDHPRELATLKNARFSPETVEAVVQYRNENIRLKTGEWLDKDEFGRFDKDQQKYLKDHGTAAFNAIQGQVLPETDGYVDREVFTKDYFKSKGWNWKGYDVFESIPLEEVGTYVQRLKEAEQAHIKKFTPGISLEEYLRRYARDNKIDFDIHRGLASETELKLLDYNLRQAGEAYRKEYGASAFWSTGASRVGEILSYAAYFANPFVGAALIALRPATRAALRPEVKVGDITGLEWSRALAEGALWAAAPSSAALKQAGHLTIAKYLPGVVRMASGSTLAVAGATDSNLDPAQRIAYGVVGGLIAFWGARNLASALKAPPAPTLKSALRSFTEQVEQAKNANEATLRNRILKNIDLELGLDTKSLAAQNRALDQAININRIRQAFGKSVTNSFLDYQKAQLELLKMASRRVALAEKIPELQKYLDTGREMLPRLGIKESALLQGKINGAEKLLKAYTTEYKASFDFVPNLSAGVKRTGEKLVLAFKTSGLGERAIGEKALSSLYNLNNYDPKFVENLNAILRAKQIPINQVVDPQGYVTSPTIRKLIRDITTAQMSANVVNYGSNIEKLLEDVTKGDAQKIYQELLTNRGQLAFLNDSKYFGELAPEQLAAVNKQIAAAEALDKKLSQKFMSTIGTMKNEYFYGGVAMNFGDMNVPVLVAPPATGAGTAISKPLIIPNSQWAELLGSAAFADAVAVTVLAGLRTAKALTTKEVQAVPEVDKVVKEFPEIRTLVAPIVKTTAAVIAKSVPRSVVSDATKEGTTVQSIVGNITGSAISAAQAAQTAPQTKTPVKTQVATQTTTTTPEPPPPPPPPRSPPPPIILGGFELGSAGVERPELLPPGALAWLSGFDWKYIPPPYKQRKPLSLGRTPPMGARTGGRTPSETLQIIGRPKARVPSRVNIDLGWADIVIRNGRTIEFAGGGLTTDVGTRDPSPTVGMSIGEPGDAGPVLSPLGRRSNRRTTRKAKSRRRGLTEYEYATTVKGFRARVNFS